MYEPFEFEGTFTPKENEIGAVMVGPLPERQWLVRAAVTSDDLAAKIVERAQRLIEGQTELGIDAALYFCRSIGLRSLVGTIVDAILNQGDVWQAPSTMCDSFSSLAAAGLDFVFVWSLPGSSKVEALLEHGLKTPGLREIAWRAIPPHRLGQYVDDMSALLQEAPQLASEMATKYALLCREKAPELCASFRDVPFETRDVFAASLEKNLRRVGRIRRWVECRTELARLKIQSRFDD